MASVSWLYPEDQLIALRRQNVAADAAAPVASGVALDSLHFRYMIDGDTPPWRPLRAFDDGKKVYIEFPYGISQGEMPPLFVIGPEGKTSDLVNYRVRGNHMIVDRLFAAAELRFGSGLFQQHVRIVRTDGRLLVSDEPPAASAPDRDLAAELRLRPERPPVTRLSRKVLMGLCAGAGIAVSGALIWGALSGAWQSNRWRRALQYREQDNGRMGSRLCRATILASHHMQYA